MEPGDSLLKSAAEPESLRKFVAELEADGFRRQEANTWVGPTRRSLIEGGHTTSDQMRVIFRPSWPYLPPLLHVAGVNAWHADRERLCIWEEEDNTQRWATLQGLYERIDEWVEAEAKGFAGAETARNPEMYWEQDPSWIGLVDLDDMIGDDRDDGAHDEFHFLARMTDQGDRNLPDVFDIRPGRSGIRLDPRQGVAKQAMSGRWFYRGEVHQPPRNLYELKDLLTDTQRYYLGKHINQHLNRGNAAMFGLAWENTEGLVCTMVLALPITGKGQDFQVGALRPKGTKAMLLRAGPDAAELQSKRVAVIGVGAIGSHVADLLVRSGVGALHLVDFDHLWPANLIRHAAPPDSPTGILKTAALANSLSKFPWTNISTPSSPQEGVVWHPEKIRQIVESADLTIDATGHGGFAELAARVAHEHQRPYVTVALFRGGSVARVRRQATFIDTPILQRPRLDRYPIIPPLADELEYVGTETGCLARIHNAPPVAVVQAAATAAEVAIDHLCDRHQQPDEVIYVLRAGDEPFHRLGRLHPEDLPASINLSEAALAAASRKAADAIPVETGGVLVGCEVDGRITITDAIEVPDRDARSDRYGMPAGAATAAVESARASEPRVGYVGEWHSHPRPGPPSTTDQVTMLDIALNPDIANPVLLIISPGTADGDIHAFVTTSAGLKPAQITMCGGLAASQDVAA